MIRFDPAREGYYHGCVLKVVTPQELARNLDPILKALEESGTTLIVKTNDQPMALLLRFDAYVAMLATMDYSGWERWIEEVRTAFPRAVFAPPRRPKPLMPAFIDPADIGYAPQFGQVGSTAGRRRLAEELSGMGIQLDENELGAVYSLVLSLAERKRVLYAEDLKLAVDEALGTASAGKFSLADIEVHAQGGVSASARVSITADGETKTATGTGSGPIDAAFRAVQQITGLEPELEDFSLAAATRGTDALGEAVVTLSQGSQVVVGKAASVDVLEAAVKAYVNALNWLVRGEQDLAGASPAGRTTT
jgi:hypothetical protein